MANNILLAMVMWQEGTNPKKLAYRCGIPLCRFWLVFCGCEPYTKREQDQICAALHITPDLRREIFGEEEGDG